ncbi:Murein DD-endopeptidase MepM [Anoxybacillus sp. P3H1B]|uniref:peptidoglycan DD-metalloendopeptidase family protein n=1 Tax=Anoxybacillus sp. P3H1B TaxID=1769293 RepID=UPI00079C4A80|nr:peptidoglycan DD-metalloendopeptidase family protein [Anoxybacillus sp. P3H1B]KXG10678.1 Murein DD-endopeptidase MepM [Anoxybacillus sp. P3H1B]
MSKLKRLTILLLTVFLIFPTITLGKVSAATNKIFLMPTSGTITQGFKAGEHFGIDIANSAANVKVNAAANGVVSRSYYSSNGYGNVVFIQHNINGQTWETVYAHLSSRAVSVGATVSKGQFIGYMGNTGNSTGQHLHFEVHKGLWNDSKSNAVNPLEYLYTSDGGTVEEGSYRLLTGVFATEADQKAAADRLRQETGWVVYTVNENGLRLKTGTFSTKEAAINGQNLIKNKFGWVSYIKQEYFRLVTGIFATEADQQRAYDRLVQDTGWVVYKISDNGLRLKTGVFATRSAAENAQNLLKNNYGWVSYINVEEVKLEQ